MDTVHEMTRPSHEVLLGRHGVNTQVPAIKKTRAAWPRSLTLRQLSKYKNFQVEIDSETAGNFMVFKNEASRIEDYWWDWPICLVVRLMPSSGLSWSFWHLIHQLRPLLIMTWMSVRARTKWRTWVPGKRRAQKESLEKGELMVRC